MKQANTEQYDILYGRLSQEDERDGDSNSIQNQRMILEQYAKEKGFTNPKFISDDGFSGTNFNRPGWSEVMRLMEQGLVRTVIVKDLSRLGREYLEMGRLIELVFPSYGVRFIAINDGVDSLYGDNDFMPFKNLFNDFYAKDTSRKIRAVKKAKAERGERISTRPNYGYKKSEDDPKKLVPNEDTAPVVKHIFELCRDGLGPSQIARKLKEEQVVNPTNYYFRTYGVELTGLDVTQPYRWRENTVATILEDEVYLGHTVSMRYTTVSYKNKKQIERPKSEWLRFENTHEPLISQELWDVVQDIRKHKRRPAKKIEEPNLFSGMVYCADCGAVMRLHRTRTKDADSYNNFKCSTYANKGKEFCSGHYIRESQLKTIVLDDLRRVTHFARKKETLLIKHIAQRDSAQARKEISQTQKSLEIMRKREKELTMLFKRLYEDNVLGRIPDEQFRLLTSEYTQEQAKIREDIPALEQRLEKLKDSLSNVARFVERAKRYEDIQKLTPELLHLFIEKIVVGERAERYSRTAPQEIRIYYRDVGLMDTPEETDLAAMAKEEAA